MWKILILVCVVLCVQAGRLPSYFTQCKKSDPKLNECMVYAGNLAIPLLAKGDEHYDIPNMKPLKFSHIVLKNDDDLQFILYDVQVHGIDTANLTHAKIDLEAGESEFVFNIPRLMVISNQYELRGRLMDIPMHGSGFANITLVDGEYTYAPSFGQRSYEFDELYEIGDHNLNYKTNKTMYYLENLFNGDDFRGFDINSLLNEKWEEIGKMFRPAARKIMGDFINMIMINLSKIVSQEEFFKE